MFNRDRLSQLIEDKGLRRESVAEKADITVQTLYNYENGKREPSIDNLVKIAAAIGTTVAYLVEETDDPRADALDTSKHLPAVDARYYEDLESEGSRRLLSSSFMASLSSDFDETKQMSREELHDFLKETERLLRIEALEHRKQMIKRELENRGE